MNFDPNNLTPETKAAFLKARESALAFAETFLLDPKSGKPFKAMYPQRLILGSKKRDLWVCVHRRSGKALPLSAKVYTPDGYTSLGELSIGSSILTPDNKVAYVTHIIPQGPKQVYKITLDDGTEIECCGDHEWAVYSKTCWKGGRGKSRQQYGTVVKTTEEIMNNLIYSYSNKKEFNYKINPITPLDFSEKDLPIDPYLFGVLLGDGHFKTRSIVSADPEVIETIVERTGFSYSKKDISGTNLAKRYFILSDLLRETIKAMGFRDVIRHKKYIPKEFLYGSLDQRIWLLRGLMDTDGSSDKRSKGQAEYCTVCKQLAEDVANLARSLGCKVRVKESKASYTKNGIRVETGIRYRLGITVPENLEIFNLNRKKCGGLPERYLRRTIINVEKLNKSIQMQCISIDDPSHLFITDNYTPTHNCVVEDTLVIDHNTLVPTPISELSHLTEVYTFDFETNQVIKAPCQWIKSGKKKCIKLELESGAHISLSTDHPVFCSVRGWVKALQIRIGDQILVPTEIPVFGDLIPEEYELQLDVDFSLTCNELSPKVFKYRKEYLAKFIQEVFLSKGRILHGSNPIVFLFWSKKLSQEIKHLLIRFGIHSKIDEDGNLFISESADKSLFLKTIGVDHTVTEVRSPRSWDAVVNIKSLGERAVYDLSVDHPDHNFIGNDIVLHNSYSMTIAALWHAITKEDQQIVIFAPSSVQVNTFFDTLDKWIAKNPFLQALQASEGNHKTPQKRTFTNGSTIQGYLMGLVGSIEGAKRGITADVVINDEAQLFSEDDWKVVLPIMRGDKTRLGKVINYSVGTTPDNPDNYYYEKIYKLPKTETEEKIFIPITKNPEYTPEQVEDIRINTPLTTWNTEWILELGEVDSAVFRKKDIESCSVYDWEYGIQNIIENDIRFIGVDWDKAQAGTNVAVFQYNVLSQTTSVIYREEVARDRFTYLNACRLILDLFDAYRPELVVTDQGQGETQWEYLLMEGERMGSQIVNRLEKKALNEKIEVPNPQTGEIEKKMIKPFLVGLLQKKMQERKFLFPKSDETLRNQLLAYKVLKVTQNTTKFSTHNEHIIDCCLFCMYGIWYLFENELDKKYGGNHNSFRVFNDSNVPANEFQTSLFWNSLEGPRVSLPGNQIPRTSIDDVFSSKPNYEKFRDFYND